MEKGTEKIIVRLAILNRETLGARPVRTPLPPRATNYTGASYSRWLRLILVVTHKQITGSDGEFHAWNPGEWPQRCETWFPKSDGKCRVLVDAYGLNPWRHDADPEEW